MRDIALFVIVFGAIPYMLRHPYIGVLMWSWLSYMNPHKLAWGFAHDFPFAQVVALVLLVSLLFDREPKRLPKNGLLAVWILFVLWMLLTTLDAYWPAPAWAQYVKVFKIQLIIFLTMLVMHTPERIKLMIWVIFCSVGFYGVKGGIYTVLTGGGGRVWGPAGGYIEENNALAIALLMVLPLGYYLLRHELTDKWLKRAMIAALVLIAFSVVGSQSRGALIAIVSVAFYLWLKTDNKLKTALFIFPALPLLFLFMPDTWHERMATIQTYEQDASAMGRINAWQYAINAASHNLLGVGFDSWSGETFARWAPDPSAVHAAHSIYFSVIADHGWVGFAMFMTLFIGGFLLARRIVRMTATLDDYAWVRDLARMIQVSLVAYATGGAFLSLSYFDLPWHLLAIILLLQQLLRREGVWESQSKPFAASLQGARGSR